MPDLVTPQESRQPFFTDGNALLFSLYQFYCRTPAKNIQLLFQSAYSCFRRVTADQPLDGTVCNFEILRFDPGFFHGLRKKMSSGDLKFLHCRIARKLDHFHTVQKRFRNRICRVRCADKEHV